MKIRDDRYVVIEERKVKGNKSQASNSIDTDPQRRRHSNDETIIKDRPFG